MNIRCNGQDVVVDTNLTLQEFLSQQNLDNKKGVAVAVNDSIVTRSNWSTLHLSENDSILIISATKGG